MTVFHTACGQKQTEPHKDNINYDIKDTVTSYGPNRMVRNVKQDRNGNILFAASHIIWFQQGNPIHLVHFNLIKIKPNTLLLLNKDTVQRFDDKSKFGGKAIFHRQFFLQDRNRHQVFAKQYFV